VSPLENAASVAKKNVVHLMHGDASWKKSEAFALYPSLDWRIIVLSGLTTGLLILSTWR